MKFHNLKTEIVKFTKKNRAVTTSEIAARFKISWNTAEKYLLELGWAGRLIKLKKQGVNIWMLK